MAPLYGSHCSDTLNTFYSTPTSVAPPLGSSVAHASDPLLWHRYSYSKALTQLLSYF